MKKQANIIGVLLVYIFVVLAHVFFLPKITSATSSSHNSIFERKVENFQSANFIQRGDKATFKESIKSPITNVALVYVNLLFIVFNTKTAAAVSAFDLEHQSFNNNRYSYLSFCTFRV